MSRTLSRHEAGNAPDASPEPDRAAVEAAARWYALMHDGAASDDERRRFDLWLDAAPAHRTAYDRVARLWARFDRLPSDTARPVRESVERLARRPGRRRARHGIALGVAAVIAATAALYGEHIAILSADVRTATGERRSIELADGSRLVLNARSAVDIRYSDTERRIVLHRGELLAEVAADASRPFVVQTRDGTATALGTTYTVRTTASDSTVAVLSSRVRACADVQACLDLPVGAAARLYRGTIKAIVATDPGASWTTGRLALDDRPLAEALERLDDYRPGLLRYDAHALAGLRVSGVIPLDDTDQALRALADTLPLRIERPLPGVLSVRPR